MYIYIYIFLCIYMYIYVHIYIYIYISICTYIYLDTYPYIYINIDYTWNIYSPCCNISTKKDSKSNILIYTCIHIKSIYIINIYTLIHLRTYIYINIDYLEYLLPLLQHQYKKEPQNQELQIAYIVRIFF
jgi:hypothetical protein